MPGDELIGYYCFKDLKGRGIVRDRSDLSRKIKFQGFPRPEKNPDAPMQAAANYKKAKVHAWLERGETEQTDAA